MSAAVAAPTRAREARRTASARHPAVEALAGADSVLCRPSHQGSTVLVPVAGLVGKPGATRSLHRTIAVEDVGDDPWGPAEDALAEQLELDLGLDSVIEGIWVHGQVTWQLEMACGRCLRPVELERTARVGELFADPRRLEEGDEVDEGYELVDDASAIDLERLLHDVIVLDLPTTVRCGRDDCVAPVGDGVSVLTEDELAQQRESEPDPRWAKLTELDLSDSSSN